MGVRAHEAAGQRISRITVSGGIARSDLMCRILASVLNRRLERLESDEGPALGAAVTALAALETHLRAGKGIEAPFTVADAVAARVRFREPVEPDPSWIEPYRQQVQEFESRTAFQTVRTVHAKAPSRKGKEAGVFVRSLVLVFPLRLGVRN